MLKYGHGSGGVHMTHFTNNIEYRHYGVNVSLSKQLTPKQQIAILKRKLAARKKKHSEYLSKRNRSRLPVDFYFWDNKMRDERNNIAKIESKIKQLEKRIGQKGLPQEQTAKNNSCKKRKQEDSQKQDHQAKCNSSTYIVPRSIVDGNKKAPPAAKDHKYPQTNKADLPKKVQAMWEAIQTMCPYATIVAYGVWLYITGTTDDDWPGLRALGCRYSKKRKCVYYALGK